MLENKLVGICWGIVKAAVLLVWNNPPWDWGWVNKVLAVGALVLPNKLPWAGCWGVGFENRLPAPGAVVVVVGFPNKLVDCWGCVAAVWLPKRLVPGVVVVAVADGLPNKPVDGAVVVDEFPNNPPAAGAWDCPEGFPKIEPDDGAEGLPNKDILKK